VSRCTRCTAGDNRIRSRGQLAPAHS
jgi:hypothetical protein